MIRSLFQHVSIRTVKYTSSPLRSHDDDGHRNTFFAVCWLMVLAPRAFLRVLFSSTAFYISTKSKPLCSANRLSSDAMTAIGRCLEILSLLTQWCLHFSSSPLVICCTLRITISGVMYTGTNRSNSTASIDDAKKKMMRFRKNLRIRLGDNICRNL